ncbi:MAG: hypothetical protein HDR00_05305 [Lachnospiraceae bacterium]|nr:hypothetical protein [Lachnospiraceae bacterium]
MKILVMYEFFENQAKEFQKSADIFNTKTKLSISSFQSPMDLFHNRFMGLFQLQEL